MTDADWLRTHRPRRYVFARLSAERRAERRRAAEREKRLACKTVYYTAPPSVELAPAQSRTPRFPTSMKLRTRLFKAQDGKCYLCGTGLIGFTARGKSPRPTIDHVFPRALGGKHSRNRLLACEPCNSKKAHRPPHPCEVLMLRAVNLLVYEMEPRRGIEPRSSSYESAALPLS